MGEFLPGLPPGTRAPFAGVFPLSAVDRRTLTVGMSASGSKSAFDRKGGLPSARSVRASEGMTANGMLRGGGPRLDERPVRAGRLATPAGPASEIDPLGDRQGVIKLDTEVADRAVHLGMTEQ